MLYAARDSIQRDFLGPINSAARQAMTFSNMFPPIFRTFTGLRYFEAYTDILEQLTRDYQKPAFGIESITVPDGAVYAVSEEVLAEKPFCRIVRFATEPERAVPRILLFAPLSGHHSTLLRETIATLLQDHEVLVTDWIDAKMVPLEEGRFGLDEYVHYAYEFMERFAEGAHVISVCQPTVPVLAALALMAEDQSKHMPKTLTLKGGPIDTRINPTKVNEHATRHELSRFDWCIESVPYRYPGRGRKVYPGFYQLGSFVGMNFTAHWRSHEEFVFSFLNQETASMEKHRRFYNEYCSTLDLPAEFYLETVERVFQEHHLPRGIFRVGGRLVRPECITYTSLLTIEGENDDISGIGQTEAAHDLCRNLPSQKRQHLLAPGVGHYGIFSGSTWKNRIYPEIRDFIAKAV